MQNTPIIIDCDTGRDDALTLWTALSMDLNLCAVVTSYGNSALDQVTDNTMRVLSVAGRNDISILKGAAIPLQDHKNLKDVVLPRQKQSGNGLCNVKLAESVRPMPEDNSAEDLAQAIKDIAEKEGAIDYYITGPATNFAAISAILGKELPHCINRVIMMGGKIDPLWSAMPGADFNLACDPFAVKETMHSGVPFTFVPMNTTWPIHINEAEIQSLESETPIGQTAKEIMLAYCKSFSPDQIFRFHDPSVLFVLKYADSKTSYTLDIICDETDENFGRLVERDSENGGVKLTLFEPTEEIKQKILQGILAALTLKQVQSTEDEAQQATS